LNSEQVDVLIVGAGISGIGAGYHLQARCPDHSYLILEGRDAIGGTWDLFRYPGIRSDSDMYTLGYSFRPWTEDQSIADGASILKYLADTAREYGIDRHIRFGHRVIRAEWSSTEATWTVDVEQGPQREVRRFTCNFLYMCGGYYNYAKGHDPDFPGRERFAGRIVHPQHWTDDIAYAGKRVVVIGSGATAVTLVPELARDAAHVTMLQRSPTYMVSRPSVDALANRLRRWLPTRLAYALTRWKNVLFGMYFFNLCRSKPELTRQGLIKLVREQLGPDYDVATHFTPRYNPWEQRLCLVPDGDFFKAIRSGRASVVTDRIDTFTEHGIRLASGEELPADLIVTATGLELQLLSGIEFVVDGRVADLPRSLNYKGMMYSGVPNLATFGHPAFRGPAGRHRRACRRRRRCAGADAHRRRQVAVLPGAGAAAPRHRHRGLAADRADAGPGRRAAPERRARGLPQFVAGRARSARGRAQRCWTASSTCSTWRPSA
jgi:monooxygenase